MIHSKGLNCYKTKGCLAGGAGLVDIYKVDTKIALYVDRKVLGVDFVNILCVNFFIQKCFDQLFLDTFQLCNFWPQNMGAKWACRMLNVTLGH